MKNPRLQSGFTLIELLVVITIIAILAGIALPVYSSIQESGLQTKALAQAKQVGLALKLYGGDNDGAFPRTGQLDAEDTAITVTTANDAYRVLIPNYAPTESIFYVARSAWSPIAPDENTTSSAERLKAGENHWAYTTNLFETSNPRFPLVADGFTTTVGTYTNDEAAKGGIWKGKKAVVIRVDQSGALEKTNSTFQVFGPTGAAAPANIFGTSANWLSASQVPVNPL